MFPNDVPVRQRSCWTWTGEGLTPGNDAVPGVFLDETDTYEVNLQTAEVYNHGKLVIPVTKAIPGHPTFHHLFWDRTPARTD